MTRARRRVYTAAIAAGMAGTQSEASLNGSKSAAISNHVVQTMSAYTGRGPTRARTYLNGDVVVVVLQDTLTKGERSLVAGDLDTLVLRCARRFRATMRHDLIAGSRGSSGARPRVYER